jgi:8-oxo-dGTP diphosphatase
LLEELGVEVHAAERLLRYSHAYPERIVRLDLWIVTSWSGEPRGLDGQALKWVSPEQLEFEDILEADWPMIDALVARSEAGITPRGVST